MKTRIRILSALMMLWPFTAAAAGEPANKESPVTVITLDPKNSLDEFAEPGVAVQTGPRAPGPQPLPALAERDSLFARSGLDKSVNEMDDVDKDMVIITLRSRGVDDAAKAFPALPKSKLEKLKKLLAERK